MSLTQVREVSRPQADPPLDGGQGSGDGGNQPPVDDRQRTERIRARSSARGVDEPRATSREISHRLASQVDKAFKDGTFGKSFTPDIGYRRRFQTSLEAEGMEASEAQVATREMYSKLQDWLEMAIRLGPSEYSSAKDFMAMVDRKINTLVDELAYVET